MEATLTGVDATPEPVTLNAHAFNIACAKRGAYKIGARARLVGVDRGTLDRWLRGPVAVPLDRAMHIARTLDLKVEDLWGTAEVKA